MRCYCTFLAPAITGGAAYGKKEEECWENSLSEAYENLTGEPRLELKVITLNINEGHNKELMEQCRTLREYAQYVAKVRKYKQEIIRAMLKAGEPLEKIVQYTGYTVEEIKDKLKNSW